MNNYPQVIDEFKTLEKLIAGRSIARYGDGEFKLCRFADCVSQQKNAMLMQDLRGLLEKPTEALIGIPNILSKTPKIKFWRDYMRPAITELLSDNKQYYSSFITRPDSAPWIDTPEYWGMFKKLWEGKNITLVRGSDKSLIESDLIGAASIETVLTPAKNAYDHINQIEEQINTDTVLLCCGATATILAERLARSGKHALDVGHIGLFINHKGIFKMDLQHLISKEYQAQNRQLHESGKGYGGSGYKSAPTIVNFANQIDAKSILDYGCGEGTLKKELKTKYEWKGFIGEYDPAIIGKDVLPKPADLVVCTDVLEHVEPDKIRSVIEHIYKLTSKGCYFNIAMRPANKWLPDGRNTHLIIENDVYWKNLISSHDWQIVNAIAKKSNDLPYSLEIWLKK